MPCLLSDLFSVTARCCNRPPFSPENELESSMYGFDPALLKDKSFSKFDHVLPLQIIVHTLTERFYSPSALRLLSLKRSLQLLLSTALLLVMEVCWNPAISEKHPKGWIILTGDGQFGHPRVFINLDKSSVEHPTPCGMNWNSSWAKDPLILY